MDVTGWLKGNTHTHTTRSDGDATVKRALAAYAEAGYDFLAITDHNRYISRGDLPRVAGGPLPIPGCELSVRSPSGHKPVHVCDLGGRGPDGPDQAPVTMSAGAAARVRKAVELARSAGGLPVVAHPCWNWALSAEDLLTIEGDFLLEIWNASSNCNNHRAGGADSPEDIWSKVLSAGRRVWGVAVDDVHKIARPAIPPIDSPAVAWVRVGAAERTEPAILAALAEGRFYASTGVELARLASGPRTFSLHVRQAHDYLYTITLLGRDNRELARADGPEISYTPKGDELFVRARVEDTNGGRCWTQPWFL